MIRQNENIFDKIRYYYQFVAHAFLLSILCLLVITVVIVVIYYGDLYLNVKSGNYKNPIFNSYIIVSPSMVPTININDAIIVKRDNNDKYGIGEIISFFSTEYDKSGMIVTHRIVNKDRKTESESIYTTKGDNNTIADKDSVSTENIYGRVLFIVPKLGYIKNFFSKPLNIILCIIIPSFFIITCDFIRVGILFKKNVKIV